MTYATAVRRIIKVQEALLSLTSDERVAIRYRTVDADGPAGELKRRIVELRQMTADFVREGEDENGGTE